MTTTLATAGTLGLTAAGGYLFGPLGAGAGALVGSFLFGGAGGKIEGPRLGDLSVAASTYGGVIPVGFGTQKVAGTIIWATDIRETKHTNTQGGGLFGGGTKVVEYRYFANFAVALGEGPAGAVTRIWAGDKLIARLRSSDHAKANHPKYRFRIYLGSEDQQPDPLIRKHVPAHAAPAHRGLVYFVFEDLPLDEFGNRVPPITAEVSWAGAAEAVANAAAINSSYQSGHFTIDPTRNRGFVRTGSTGDLVRLNLSTMSEEFRRPIDEIYSAQVHLSPAATDPNGDLFAFGGTTSSTLLKIDGNSLTLAAEVATPSNGDFLEILSIYDLSGRTDWVLWVRFLGVDTRLYRTEDLSLFWAAPDGVSTRPRGAVAGREDFGRAEAFVLGAPSIVLGTDTFSVTLRHIVIEAPFFKDPISGDIPGLSYQDITLQASDFGFDTIVERVMHDWQTDWTHLDLEPGDVVQIALHDGSLFAVRLLQCELGANLAVSWQTVVEESSSYTVPAVPAVGLNYIPRVEPVSSAAKLFVLDLPLLQDLDDVQRVATGTYWAGGAWFEPPWKGAVLFSSDDGAVYASVDETFAAVPWGAAINALPDTDTPFQTDSTSALQVTMVSGALSSVTALEMLNGTNRAALIRSDKVAEIIQFQDAVLEDGVYTLTHLLRGRRGTEVFTGGHAAGDVFVLLDGVARRGLTLDRVGDTLYHRLVGRGGELRDAPTRSIAFAGRDLMPYAPAHLKVNGLVGGGSNISVTWVRRTRVGGELLDGTGDVPLSEDEELYDLVIYDGSDAVLRTVPDLSSPAFTYTAAMQAEDFSSGGPGRLAVYQVSAQVGRGFEAGADLEFAP